jgi:hypothetical protein
LKDFILTNNFLDHVHENTYGIIWPLSEEHLSQAHDEPFLQDLDYLFNGLLSPHTFSFKHVLEKDFFFQTKQYNHPIFLIIGMENKIKKIFQHNKNAFLPLLPGEKAQLILITDEQHPHLSLQKQLKDQTPEVSIVPFLRSSLSTQGITQ